MGTHRTATIAGTVMAPESGNVDEDYFSLGTVQGGETVFLSLRLPESSTLRPIIEIRNSAGGVVSVAPNPSEAVARVDITASGTYYAVVVAMSGQGPRGQYLLDAAIWPTGELEFADLVPSEVAGPATASSGETVTFTWEVGNYGTGVTDAISWYDRVVLSANDRYGDGDDVYLGSVRHDGALNVGDSAYVGQIEVRLPLGISGDYRVFVEADETKAVFEYIFEGNNIASGASQISIELTPYGDLTASNVGSPAIGVAGQPYSVTWSVTNLGNGTTGDGTPGGDVAAWTDRIVFSRNMTLGDGDDVLVANVLHTGALGAGEGYAGSWSGNLPVGLSGDYHLIVVTDFPDDVYEYADAQTNVAVKTETVAVAPAVFADLTVTAFAAPATASVGEQLLLSWTVQNTSAAWAATPATQWYDRVVLSQDAVYGNSDDRNIGEFLHGGVLGIGETYDGSGTVTVPTDVSGLYHLFLVTDARGAVYEWAYEGNNASMPTSLEVHLPDLEISGLASPGSIVVGEAFAVSWTVGNVGVGEAFANWYDRAYLSQDAVLDGSDLALGSAVYRPGYPGAMATYTPNVSVSVPTSYLTEGPHWLIVKIDTAGSQVESSEANNVAMAPVTITLPPHPDLEVTSVPTPASNGWSGQPLGVHWTVTNSGEAAASGSWSDTVYLSTDGTVGGAIKSVAFARPTTLGSGESYEQQVSFGLPNGIEGTYYLVIKADSQGQVAEFDGEGNNILASASFTVNLTPPPDLQVTDIETSAPAMSGKPVTIQWTVTNLGTGPATGSWNDRVYFSPDATLGNGNDTYIGSFSRPADLAVGESHERSTTWTLPNGIDGTYYILVKADYDNTLYEHANEGNNVGGHAFDVILTQPPDLQVTAVAPPAEGWSGRAIDVGWSVINAGPGVAEGTWVDKIYLSADDQIGADTYLGELTRPNNLASGEGYSRSHTFLLPDGVSGNQRIVVVADANNNVYEHTPAAETNNGTISDPFPVHLTPYADLQVTAAQVQPVAYAGQTLTFNWMVTNNGDASTDTSAWYDVVYLSVNLMPQGIVRTLGTYQNASYLAPGESYVQTQQVTIPEGFLAGDYYLLVKTDFYNAVKEWDAAGTREANNLRFSDQPVDLQRPWRPDLQVLSVTVPNDGWSGDTVEVRWEAINAGQTHTYPDSWNDAVYLSTDQTLVTSPADAAHDLLLGTFPHTGNLYPSDSYAQLRNVPVPIDVHTGDYYIFVLADQAAVVYEDVEGNNSAFDAGAIHITQPPIADLQVAALVAPGVARTDSPIEVSWTVSNEGGGPTNRSRWTDAVYLSTDLTLVADQSNLLHDTLLGTVVHDGVVAGYGDTGSSYQQTASFQMPTNLSSGPYYLFVVTDSGNTVYEYATSYDAEANNTRATPAPIAVSYTPPDLRVVSVDPPAGVSSGQTVTAGWTILNAGVGRTVPGTWKDRLYLSSDAVLDYGSGDTLLGVISHSGRLEPSQSYAGSASVRLPDGLDGTYWLFVETDVEKVVQESADTNNVGSSAWQITLTPPPDLQVSQVMIPADAWSGQPMTVAWTVTNAGSGPTRPSEGSWIDSVYLSADPVFDPTDTRLGTFTHNGTLQPGDSYTQSRQVTLPIGISGNYWVFVQTDMARPGWPYYEPFGKVYEYDKEDNNIGDPGFTVHLTNPPDLVVSSVDSPAIAYSGQPITVAWTVSNTGTGETVPGSWDDQIYLSRDQNLDRNDDVSLGYVRHNGVLSAGQSYSASLTATVPSAASGPYYVFVLTDARRVWGSDHSEVFEWAADHDAEANNATFDPVATVVVMPPPADLLLASDIVVPGSGVVGQSPASDIRWTVTNLGTAAATGAWYDVLYLSTDGVWDLSDAVIDRVQHSGEVAIGTSYIGTSHAKLPAVVPGDYHVIVRTDIRNQLRESDEANNWMPSADTITVDVPELFVGQPVTGSLVSGQPLYYRLAAEAGQDIALHLSAGNPDSVTELYVRYGGMPDQTAFDLADSEPFTADHEVVITGAYTGHYYILVNPESLSSSSLTFTLSAELLEFSLRSVGPTSVGNAGSSTLIFSGIRMPYGSIPMLSSPAGDAVLASKTWWVDPQTIYATFNLTGAAVGAYDAVLTAPDGTITRLDDSLQVTVGTGPRLETRLVAPDVVWSGRLLGPEYHMFEILVEYTNVGDADMPAPYFVASGSPDMPIALYPDQTPAPSTLEFLGINQNGPAGILAPGSGGSIPFFSDNQPFMAWGYGPTEMFFDYNLYVLSPSQTPMDWSGLAASSKPDGMDADAWTALWDNLAGQVGGTWGDYVNMLADNATYLGVLGKPTYDIGNLFAFELQQANATLARDPLATSLDAYSPAPGMDLTFSRAFSQSLLGRYELGPMGRGWSDNWQISIEEAESGDVTVLLPAGGRRFFTKNADGTYAASTGDYGTLALELGHYRLTEQGGTVLAFRTDLAIDYVEDTNGNRITAGYTGGRLTSLTHSSGDILSIQYNAQGRISRVTDPAGRTTDYAYDASGEHLLSVTDVTGTTAYTYSAEPTGPKAHTLTSIAYPGGTHAYYEYDADGRLSLTYRDGGAESVSYAYDSAGTMYATDAAGARTTVMYDDAGQIGQVHDPLGRSIRFQYDDAGNLVQLSAPQGITYAYEYDDQGHLVSQVNPLGHRIDLAYDPALDRLTSVRDARGNTTGYAYDVQGNLRSITYPNGSAEEFNYDPLGNLTESINRRGQAIGYAYDSDGLLIRKDYADGTHVDFAYDARGNMTSAVDSAGTTTMEYDSADRLMKITYPTGRFLEFAYDAGGRRTSMVDQDGLTTNYQYDAAGRLAGLTDGDGAMVVAYAYDAVGRLVRKDCGNGTYSTYEYDLAGQLLHLVNFAPGGAVNSRFDYTYDDLGRRTSMDTVDGLWTYEYDATGQLTRAVLDSTNPAIPDQDLAYVYDAAGNRIQTIANGVTTNYTTNDMNQYVTVGSAAYEYDADGNMISKTEGADAWTYAYNDENRLTQVVTPDGTWAYEYDAFGNRVATTQNGQRTEYLLDPAGLVNVVGEYDGAGDLIARYRHGYGLISRSDAIGNAAYYAFSAIGNTSELTSSGATALNAYSYDPFGISLAKSGTVPNSFEFVGEYGVQADGAALTYMRRRTYDGSLGRFRSKDPLGILESANLYTYVGNSPVCATDVTGFSKDIPLSDVRGQRARLVNVVTNKFGWVAGGAVATLLDFPFTPVGFVVGILQTGQNFGEAWGAGTPSAKFWATADVAMLLLPRLTPREISVIVSSELDGIMYWRPEWVVNPWHKIANTAETLWDLTRTAWDEWSNVCAVKRVTGRKSGSPEEKFGPAGYGDQNYVAPGELLPYKITFWNKPEASAAAKVVEIYDQLDDDLDWRTFRLGDIAPLPDVVSKDAHGRTHYHGLVNLGDEHGNILVEIDAGLDILTGRVHWIFTTIDPATGEQTQNPVGGFLAPNDDANSFVGFVTYTVRAKKTAPSGAEIDNRAEVIFDLDPANLTNTVTNVIDAAAPASAVGALASSQPSTTFQVDWSGADDTDGSGLAAYDLYVSDNGGPYRLWLSGTSDASAVFEGEQTHTYAFYSRARDQVGNLEAAPTAPDAVTVVPDLVPPAVADNGVTINGGLAQRSKIKNVAVQFSEGVTISAGALTLHNDTTGEDVILPTGALSYDATTHKASWDLSAVALADGYYTATLLASTVHDDYGNPMADDYEFTFHVLKCDANGDAKVDGGDLAIWQQHYDPLGQNPNTPGIGDWNGDGKVDGGDLALWQQRYNPLGLAAPMKAGGALALTESRLTMPGAEPTSVSEPMATPPLATAEVPAGSSGSESAAVGNVLGSEFLNLSAQGDAETDTQPPTSLEETLPEAEGTAISVVLMPESATLADNFSADETPSETVLSPSATGDPFAQGEPGELGVGEDGLEDILSLAELILPLAE
ncbi:MAG TPA: CARDB domain-containing protein [Phycisphaerae bacterium]|nr:CARDB domain-containing protein [Phycisphaerae bacterium]